MWLQARNLVKVALGVGLTASVLSGCGSTIAFTYGSEEGAWKQARDAATEAATKGNNVLAEQQYEVAAKHARHIESTNPHHLAETLQQLGAAYIRTGKLDQALATYQEALRICLGMSDNPEASELYKRIGRLGEAKCHLAIARIFIAQKKNDQAKAAFEDGLKIKAYRSSIFPLMAELKLSYADFLDKLGERPEKSKELREQAHDVNENYLEGL